MPVPTQHFDEMNLPDGGVRAHYRHLVDSLAKMPPERVAEKRREADLFKL